MYPSPPGLEKLKQVRVTSDVPPPPHKNDKVGFQVKVTLWFWLMYPPPPRNIGFCPSCNFSNLFPPKWLRITWNGQFFLICNFSNLFPPKWLRMANFTQFATFPIFSHQSDSQWSILPDPQLSNLFPLKWLRMTQNGQFHPICNFSNLFPSKWLRMTRNSQFHLICNFSNLFPRSVSE